jgi:hypothetical protein
MRIGRRCFERRCEARMLPEWHSGTPFPSIPASTADADALADPLLRVSPWALACLLP